MSQNPLYTLTRILCPVWVLCVLVPVSSLAEKEEKDIWQTHEILANRLMAEWYRIDVLRNDLESIRDILEDLSDFELYPQKVTKLNEDKLVAFDRTIEKATKKFQSLFDENFSLIKVLSCFSISVA